MRESWRAYALAAKQSRDTARADKDERIKSLKAELGYIHISRLMLQRLGVSTKAHPPAQSTHNGTETRITFDSDHGEYFTANDGEDELYFYIECNEQGCTNHAAISQVKCWADVGDVISESKEEDGDICYQCFRKKPMQVNEAQFLKG